MNSAADNKIIEDWAREYGLGPYGEQCADTDGLAKPALGQRQEESEVTYMQWLDAQVAKLTLRAEQAERNLERTIAERDALRTELNQRMAIPAQALRRGNFW